MTWLTNVVFRNQEIKNERLELTDKKSLYFLSTNLTLRNCTIVVNVSANHLVIKQPRFVDCTFDVKTELKNFQEWIFASLKGCRFKGRFSSCDFGCWPGYADGSEQGSIEDCDFTEARLDGCRFMGCDPRTIQYPRWPCFTIIDPIGHSQELNRVSWPGRVGAILMEDLHTNPPVTAALTLHAPSLAKRYDTTEDDLRAAIARFDFIHS